MDAPKVTFDKLEGGSFETGDIYLKAEFQQKSVMLKTSYRQIADLQVKLAQQLGSSFTDRFEQITLDALNSCGGILIQFFFDDALGKEFISLNEHFIEFFSTVQKFQINTSNQIVINDSMNKQKEQSSQLQQQSQLNDFKQEQNQIKNVKQVYCPSNLGEVDQSYLDSNTSYIDTEIYKQSITSNNNNQCNYTEIPQNNINNNKIIFQNLRYIQDSSLNKEKVIQKKARKLKKHAAIPIENIYQNNRDLLEEKIHSERKYIKFSNYLRRKLKSKLKFLFKRRQNLQGQMIQKCFDCCKCLKNMYFGIRCFHCKRQDVYYCHNCNTKCPDCGILLKKTNDHTNINNFYKLLNDSFQTCYACRDDISLINYEEHLYSCEDNYETCKYCNTQQHFKDLNIHMEKYCQNKPVTCNICNAKYPRYKQTSHKCMKQFYKIHTNLANEFSHIKQTLLNKFDSIQEKIKMLSTSSSQSNYYYPPNPPNFF